MLRLRALLLGALGLAFATVAAASPQPDPQSFVGPTQILFMDADTVFVLHSLEWQSASTRHQEKLLLRQLRLAYWRDHLPADMRMVFEALGYPTGRLLLTPTGHTEEWWYYGQLAPPLRFVDSALIDRDRFEDLTRP